MSSAIFFVVFLVVGAAAGAGWRDCTVGQPLMNVSDFSVTPASPKHGAFVRVGFVAAWAAALTGGSVNFTMTFNGAPFRHAVHDLCHVLLLMHKFEPAVPLCPVPPQPTGFSFKSAPIFVPPTVPVGVYSARLELSDSAGTAFNCIALDLTIRN